MADGEMCAAVFRQGLADAQLETLAIPALRSDEVLVKLVATGVCHTDLTCRDGFMPLPRPVVLGHEGAGVVERVGADVTTVAPGDHVVMSFLTCGTCPACVQDRPFACEHFTAANLSGRRLDGSSALHGGEGDSISGHFFGQSSFATHSVANVRNVVKVRQDAPLELLGPLGCGVLTGAGAIMNVLRPGAGASLAVFGAGGVGLSAVMAAVLLGCSPIVVIEPRAERRALALEVGATHAVDPTATSDLPADLRALAAGGLDYVLDTSGIPEVIAQGAAALAHGGHIGLVAMNTLEAVTQLPIMMLVGNCITVQGVRMGACTPAQFIPQLVDLIMDGRLPLEKLVRFYPLEQFNSALADQDEGRTVKPIIRMT